MEASALCGLTTKTVLQSSCLRTQLLRTRALLPPICHSIVAFPMDNHSGWIREQVRVEKPRPYPVLVILALCYIYDTYFQPVDRPRVHSFS